MRRPDLVVSELEALNTFAWKTALSRTKLILWGHAKPYVSDSSPLADRIEWGLARQADGIMTYAESGRDYLVREAHIAPSVVHAIGNSTDSLALREALAQIDNHRIKTLRRRFGEGPRALFVGGLDESKRIDFILAAAKSAQRLDHKFKLIMVGRGRLEYKVRPLSQPDGPIIYLPSARGPELAELGAISGAVWMPGRVGLVAVDSAALGLTLCTTNYKYHAPEIEFLRGSEVLFLPDDVESFARAGLAAVLNDPGPGHRLMRHDIPSIATVASNFAEVVRSILLTS